jgi:hypothetical protein
MDKETISRIVKRISEDKCLVILGPELLYEICENVARKVKSPKSSNYSIARQISNKPVP